MCGRNSLFHSPAELSEHFKATWSIDSFEPRYNIAPTQQQPVITNETPDEIVELRWGFLPHWEDDLNNGFINARAETAPDKPAFRDAWEHRTCLVLSSGFYEWASPNGGRKQPYRIHRSDDKPFAMAGLWSEWTDNEGELVQTFTILTTEPNHLVEPIHNRMPVILRPGRTGGWLEMGPHERKVFCEPYPDDDLTAYPISTRVNNPANNGPEIIEPAETEQSGLGEFS